MAAEAEVSSQVQTGSNSATCNAHWPTSSFTEHCLQASFRPHGTTFALPTSLCPERLGKQLPGIEAESSFWRGAADREDTGLQAQPWKFRLPAGPLPPSGLPSLQRMVLPSRQRMVPAPSEVGFGLSLRSPRPPSSGDLQKQQVIHPQNCKLRSLGGVDSPRFGSSIPSTADTVSSGPIGSSTGVTFAIPTSLRKCDAEEPLPLDEICADIWEEPMPADNSYMDSWRADDAEEHMRLKNGYKVSWRADDGAEEHMQLKSSYEDSWRADDSEEHMRLKSTYKESWRSLEKLDQDDSSPMSFSVQLHSQI
eukprot:TRINITY_DN45309_c0_g1_i1.p1 TRINITY_DN45309_c0_g1~~TRINITY_DN45309_c0_g1_i1.p1  ORF type:complete len:308 (+),score=53.00 TRINITY_DN45309_c0_g1_i1:81-1004(+)